MKMNQTSIFISSEKSVGFDAQQGFLGYQSFIIDALADESTNTAYISNVSPGQRGIFMNM